MLIHYHCAHESLSQFRGSCGGPNERIIRFQEMIEKIHQSVKGRISLVALFRWQPIVFHRTSLAL